MYNQKGVNKNSKNEPQVIKSSMALVQKVYECLDKGQKSEVITYFNKAVSYLETHKDEMSKHSIKLSEMYSSLADALVKVDRSSDAIKIYDKAIQINSGNVEALVKKGETLTYLASKMHENLLSSFDSALKIEPNHLRALTCKGEALEMMNRTQEALDCYYTIIEHHPNEIEIFDRILRLNPKDKSVWDAKGRVLGNLGRNEEALLCYEKALEIDPDDVHLLMGKAFILENLGDYEKAVSIIKEGIKRDSKNKILWSGMGQILHKKGESKEALSAYEEALKLDVRDHSIWNNKGAVLLEMKRPDDALTAYKTAHKLAPDNIHTLNNIRNILKTLNKNEELLGICDKILQIEPTKIEVLNEKANILITLGQYKQALGFFENVLDIDSKNLDALFGKKDAYMNLGDYEELNATCQTILSMDNKSPRIWEDKAFALEKLNDLDGANSAYGKAIELDPENMGLWLKKKDILRSLNRYEEMINTSQNILKKEPNNLEVLVDCGEAYERLNRYDEAIKAFTAVLDLKPNDTGILTKKGRILCKKGMMNESIDFFDQALKTEKADKTIWNYRGMAFFKMGNYEEAKNSYDKALELDSVDGNIWINKSLALFNMNSYDEAMEAINTAMDHSETIDSAKGIIETGIDTEIKVFISITKSILSEKERESCQTSLSKAKMALKKENYEKAHRFCIECKNTIELYTKNILDTTEELVSSLNDMGFDASNFKNSLDEMKALIMKRNYTQAYPISESLKNNVLKEQYNILSDVFGAIKKEIKSAEDSQLVVQKQKKSLEDAKDAAQNQLYKKAYDIIIQVKKELQVIREKNKELNEALDLVIEKVKNALEKGVNTQTVAKKLSNAKAAILKNEFEIASDMITECDKEIETLIINQTINEKINCTNELLELIRELKINPDEVESSLQNTNDLLSKGEHENALTVINQGIEKAETLCNLRILEMLTKIKTTINEEKKFGLEVMSAEAIYKRTEDYLLSRRFKMAALYAQKCLKEVEEIRDESLRAAYIIRLGKSIISEADNISADTKSAKDAYKKAISGLEDYQYFTAIEMGHNSIKSASISKEERVREIISQAKAQITKSKTQGKDVRNAEDLIRESEAELNDDKHLNALKLAIFSLKEIGAAETQKDNIQGMIDSIKKRFKETIQQGLSSDILRSHIMDAEKALKNGDYASACDYSILGIRELSMLREEYDRASISLISASARLKEVEHIGFDIMDIKEIFIQAKEEFAAKNYNKSLELVKKTIMDSKEFYKEHLKKPITHCEELVKTAEDIGANAIRANNILLEAKAALDEELFTQVPLFVENCQKITEREIKKKLYEKLAEAKEHLKSQEGYGMDITEAKKILKQGETSLENKEYLQSHNLIQKCLDKI